MRIVHISDFHGQTTKLPSADVYVVTGDMLPNNPTLTIRDRFTPAETKFQLCDPVSTELRFPRPDGYVVGREINFFEEERYQKNWCAKYPFRDLFGIGDSPVVCVRGNHDFISLGNWIGGDVFEINEPRDQRKIKDVVFGGCRGINFIAGEWSDELSEEMFEMKVDEIPRHLDVLVTHSPPHGVLDGANYGSHSLRRYIDRAFYNKSDLRAHLFGHTHEQGGNIVQGGDIIFSNAATHVNEIDI